MATPKSIKGSNITNGYKKPVATKMKSRARFEISSVIDEFSAVNNSILVNDGDKTMLGTAIPYLYNLYSDLIVNPSSVSVSEFQKMVYSQPVIKAALTMLGNLVKNEMGKYQHINQKYKDLINKMFDNMNRSFDDLITDMLTSLWAGFYVGEKKYVSDGRYIYVADIEPRPAQSIIYRVDSQGHLKEDGIIQYYFNNLWTGYGNLLAFNQVNSCGGQRPNPYASIGDFDYPWRIVWAQPIGTVIIPKSKCVHFAYKGLDGLDSPYGRSLLRDAYDSYLVRAELTKITRNAANFKASQIPVVIVNPDQTNTDEGQSAFDQIGYNLETLGTAGGDNPYLLIQGVGGGDQQSIWLDRLDSTADLKDFVALNTYFDAQMLLSCLFQSDIMGLSDKGSYGLGESQQDLIGRNINAIVKMLKQCVIKQVVQPILEVNFNEKEDFGTFANIDNVSEDVALNLDKLGTLRNEGIKLTTEAIMKMLDLHIDDVESVTDIPLGTEAQGKDTANANLNANYVRDKKVLHK